MARAGAELRSGAGGAGGGGVGGGAIPRRQGIWQGNSPEHAATRRFGCRFAVTAQGLGANSLRRVGRSPDHAAEKFLRWQGTFGADRECRSVP
jgi:hypothetical protein